MVHNRNCETAEHPGCACGGCGGALHGWPGFRRLAQGSPEARRKHRAAVDGAWFAALGSKGDPAGRPITMRRVAAKRAKADMADLLARDQVLLGRFTRMGDHLSGPVRDTAMGLAEKQPCQDGKNAGPRTRTLGHFWCSLLAEVSRALDKVGDMAEAPAEAAASIEESDPESRHPFEDELHEQLVVLTLRSLVITQMHHEPILLMRIMAVFMCPDPARHPQIAKQCLFPLVGEAIGDDAAASLRRAFGDPEAE